MGASNREKLLLLLLPALVVMVIYLIAFNRQRELNSAMAGLVSAEASAVKDSQVLAERAKLAGLQADLDDWTKRKGSVANRWKALASARQLTSSERAREYQRLSNRLWQAGLFTFAESTDLGSTQALPDSINQVMKQVSQAQPGLRFDRHRLWTVELFGDFATVTKVLGEISNDPHALATPVGITMAEALPDLRLRWWTVVFWM